MARDYRFDGSMPEEVLRSYLSRSMTTMNLLTGHGDFDDNLRMLTHCGVKFAGCAVYQWGREEGGESALPRKLDRASENAARIHAVDPDLILQACIFEIVSSDVEKLPAPSTENAGTMSINAARRPQTVSGRRKPSALFGLPIRPAQLPSYDFSANKYGRRKASEFEGWIRNSIPLIQPVATARRANGAAKIHCARPVCFFAERAFGTR